MSIRFEMPQELEQQIRTEGVDPNSEAREVYLMEQFRRARMTHRQLEEALSLGFYEVEQRLKERGLGQDIDLEEFEAGREHLKKARLG